MNRFALVVALLGWFFMFKVPHPELHGITVNVLVGFFKDKQTCTEEFNKIATALPDSPGFAVSECEQAEDI